MQVSPDAPGYLILHGEADDVVDVERAKASAQRLQTEAGAAVRVGIYPDLGHTLSEGELVEIRAFLSRVSMGLTPSNGWLEHRSQELGFDWGGVIGTLQNNCRVRPAYHRTCSNEAERRTAIGVERHSCFEGCLSSPPGTCEVIQYQHDVTGLGLANNYCHLYPRCVPGAYSSQHSANWCIEILSRPRQSKT